MNQVNLNAIKESLYAALPIVGSYYGQAVTVLAANSTPIVIAIVAIAAVALIGFACYKSYASIKTENNTAAILYKKTENSKAVLDKFAENKSAPFILAADKEGQTFLHHFLGMKQNIQKDQIEALQLNLGCDLFKEALLKTNPNNQTPIDLAIATGQMGVISVVFPVPPENSVKFSDIEKLSIINGVKNLIEIFADPVRKKEHMEKCPGKLNYDNENHILSTLFHLVCNDFDLTSVLESMSDDQILNLPTSFRLLIENSNSEDYKKITQNLIQECKDLKTIEEIDNKREEWNYKCIQRNNTKFIPKAQVLNPFQENILLGMIEGAVLGHDDKTKNTYFNYLSDTLDPFAPYDQNIDLSDKKYADILHKVINLALQNRDLDIQNEIEPIVEMLILKYPDFLTNRTVHGTALECLNETARLNEINLDPFNGIINILEHYSNVNPIEALFTLQAKRTLKYYLEDKGSELKKNNNLVNII